MFELDYNLEEVACLRDRTPMQPFPGCVETDDLTRRVARLHRATLRYIRQRLRRKLRGTLNAKGVS